MNVAIFGGEHSPSTSIETSFFETHVQQVVKKVLPMCNRVNNPEINTAVPQLHDWSEVCAESTGKRAIWMAGLGLKISGFSFLH